MENQTVWFQQEGETPTAYASFCAFRDMGTARTMDGAYRRLREKEGKPAGNQAPNSWWKWAVDHDWKTRTRAYDQALEKEQVEIEARRRRERIERAHDEIDADAQLMAKVNRKALKKVEKALDTTEIESDAMRNVTSMMRAATHGMQVSTAARMEALGISELLDGREALQREEEEDEEDE